MSIFTLITVVTYSSFKLSTLLDKTDYKIKQSDQENYFDIDESFGAD